MGGSFPLSIRAGTVPEPFWKRSGSVSEPFQNRSKTAGIPERILNRSETVPERFQFDAKKDRTHVNCQPGYSISESGWSFRGMHHALYLVECGDI